MGATHQFCLIGGRPLIQTGVEAALSFIQHPVVDRDGPAATFEAI